MKFITAKNANDAFIKICKELKENGTIISPRGQETIELRDVFIEILNPKDNHVTIPEAPVNEDYVEAELDWYLSGDIRVESIAKHSKFWLKLQNENGTVNSNYGYLALIQQWNGKSQYQWCLESLKKDKMTRQAIINYNQPVHKFEANKDFVCTINQNFRYDYLLDKIESNTFMRSNDTVLGFRNDLPWFTYLQNKLANDLGTKSGSYNHFASSLHIYKRHFSIMEEVCKNY